MRFVKIPPLEGLRSVATPPPRRTISRVRLRQQRCARSLQPVGDEMEGRVGQLKVRPRMVSGRRPGNMVEAAHHPTSTFPFVVWPRAAHRAEHVATSPCAVCFPEPSSQSFRRCCRHRRPCAVHGLKSLAWRERGIPAPCRPFHRITQRLLCTGPVAVVEIEKHRATSQDIGASIFQVS